MKYFKNLPKTNFESTIGTFSISDFFTYISPNTDRIQTSPISFDSKTNLLEASYGVYKDVNSFWMFVLANNTINPFNLGSINSSLFVKENKEKTSLELYGNTAGTTGYVFPPGSIIAPYVANTGGSYSYSSVGNFDLNGPLSIIESAMYIDGTMIIKDQRGATYTFINQNGTTGSQVVVIYKTGTGDYEIQTPLFPTNTKSAINDVVKVELSAEGYIEEYVNPVSPTKTKGSKGTSTPLALPSLSTGTSEITALQVVEKQSKDINAFVPQQTGTLKSLFISAKYI
jgi:hypothetical protein